ncbi:hypothetical protein M8J76_012123 [Diaphorina citri]|nr:hypothetical protein M8J76_012123 [Diaphorina citri]
MLSASRWVFLLAMCLPDSKAIINEEVKIIKYPDKQQEPRLENSEDGADVIPRHFSSPLDKCTYKVHHVLGTLSNRRSSSADTSTLDLSGYALHQTLRTAPYDMYITNMRIRLPYHKQGYIRIDKCRYDDLHKLLQTNMLFRDLTITGNIQLYSDQLGKKLHQEDQEVRESELLGKDLLDHLNNYNKYYYSNNYHNGYHQQFPRPVENCNMTLKLKSVGLGFSAIPEQVIETETSRNINIKTTATYLEPNYISIHAYNCKNSLAGGGTDRKTRLGGTFGDDQFHVYKKVDGDGEDDLESEMEQVFIKGSRSLLTNYMEKQFKNVLRDSLMTNLGYTVSYGRKR